MPINRQKSLQSLKLLLEDAMAGSLQPDDRVYRACVSQGSLAAHSDRARGVIPCALNTLKLTCQSGTISFEDLDALRRSVKNSYLGSENRNAPSASITTPAPAQDLISLQQDLFLVTKGLRDALRLAEQLSDIAGTEASRDLLRQVRSDILRSLPSAVPSRGGNHLRTVDG